MGMAVTKSELIERVAARQAQLSAKDVELAIKTMIEEMSQTLATGGRIEIRGFGSFSLHFRAPRTGRNPKTGEAVDLTGKYVPHFKPGKELRERVNDAAQQDGPIAPAGDGKSSTVASDMRGLSSSLSINPGSPGLTR
jgi:integration host factor subunit beta